IGTAKVMKHEQSGVPHHLLDLRDPGESFSAAEYQTIARLVIDDILARGKTPVLAGGTGLYIDSALFNYRYEEEDPSVKEETARLIRRMMGGASLWTRLEAVDPDSAKRLHPNDEKRILRALAYHQIHGKPISMNNAAYKTPVLHYPTQWFGLTLDRDKLYQRIDRRVDLMMDAGFLSEVQDLYRQGLRPDSQAGHGIGYRQLLQYIEGGLSLEAAVESIKRESRRYAKRQLTWFRRNPHIHWLDGEEAQNDGFCGILA
ncbi:MAG: tRNA (adenosine(37)-N6)-dimethylallyltransferase MiaA, partial [Clostridiales bacterium]|nr:tRNA (adenosine(37)-N6)-dimethylallyltransferase MiaA [Clostridiales bacterium]